MKSFFLSMFVAFAWMMAVVARNEPVAVPCVLFALLVTLYNMKFHWKSVKDVERKVISIVAPWVSGALMVIALERTGFFNGMVAEAPTLMLCGLIAFSQWLLDEFLLNKEG